MENKYSILIVDANSEELMQLIAFMEDKYDLTDVNNGTACIEQAVTTYPDLILLDDMASEPNCYEVCHTLKSDSDTQNIPIILMSDLNAEELEDEIAYLMSDDYICKPIQRADLLEKVDTLLAFSHTH